MTNDNVSAEILPSVPEVPPHLRRDPYVSINFVRESDDRYWLTLFFPDETVVRLPMTEVEATQLYLAVSSRNGSVKVKV